MNDDRDEGQRNESRAEQLREARERMRPVAEAYNEESRQAASVADEFNEFSMRDELGEEIVGWEPELWHALTELLRQQPGQLDRNRLMTRAVRGALSAEMSRDCDPEIESQRGEPPISEGAEQTLREISLYPGFSLPRLQRRVGMRNLEKELDNWPEGRHGELLTQLRAYFTHHGRAVQMMPATLFTSCRPACSRHCGRLAVDGSRLCADVVTVADRMALGQGGADLRLGW